MQENFKDGAPEGAQSAAKDGTCPSKGKKGSKPNPRGKGKRGGKRSGDPKPDGSKGKYFNDPTWYSHTPQLVQDTANISFYTAAGNKIPKLYDYTNFHQVTHAVPGIMRITTLPTYGIAENESSAINVAANNIYANIRYVNSGGRNYDAPDLMLYFLAVENAYSFLTWMQRIYGFINVYSAQNRYMPASLIGAMGGSFDDLQMHIVDLRAYINMFAAKVSAFYVPATMPFSIAHSKLYANVYIDTATTIKGQLYVFNPKCFYVYEELEGAGKLKPEFLSENMTFAEIVAFGNDMIQRLSYSEDIGIMSGDVYKAYGAKGIIQATMINENFRLAPVYAPEILSQIENMYAFSIAAPEIVQDVNRNILKTDYTHTYTGPATSFMVGIIMEGMSKFPLNVHAATVTPTDVMEMTRYIPTIEVTGGGSEGNYSVTTKVTSVGAFIVTGFSVWTLNYKDNGEVQTTVSANYTSLVGTSGTIIQLIFDDIKDIMVFDHHPALFIYAKTGSDEEIVHDFCVNKIVQSVRLNPVPMTQVENMAFVDRESLYNMNEAAVLSLFGVPQTPGFTFKA